jgi:hypothetical protein
VSRQIAPPETFEEALLRFEALEARLELPAWRVGHVFVWKLLRHTVFQSYLEAHGLAGAAHPERERHRRSKLRRIASFPLAFVRRNPFLTDPRGVQRIVIPHERKRLVAGRWVDPLSHSVWGGPARSSSLVLDRVSPIDATATAGTPSYEVLLGLAWSRRRAFSARMRKEDEVRADDVDASLWPPGGVRAVTMRERAEHAASAFLGMRSVFGSLLRRTRPRALYVVVGYGKEAAIDAAREQGVATAEFQHGALGRGHPAYDYSGWPEVPYFADTILAFGLEWFRDVSLPTTIRRIGIGAPHIEGPIHAASQGIERDGRQLLVLSQGTVAADLLRELATFMTLRPDWRVVVRPHPSEQPETVRGLLRSQAPDAVDRVVIENERSLAEQAVGCVAAVGVNSTALIEVMLAGCRIAVMQFEGAASYFRRLAEDGHARLVHSGAHLAECVDDLPLGSARGYFAEPTRDVAALVERTEP